MKEIYKLSGGELSRLIHKKEVSPVEVIDEALNRVEKLNPEINAFCTVDTDNARRTAKEAENMILSGEGDDKPLLGLPFGVKDLIGTKGVRTTFGSRFYADNVPDEDDIAIARLRDAGAILLGKTNTPEFGYEGVTDNKVFGVTRNPWDLTKTPGGSSGGSAAAVASGMCALSVGNDGGGSVRIPTCFCGLYGIKPSFGRIPLYPGCRDPRYPGASSWENLECIGPITRTVEDSAMMLSAMAGPYIMDRHSLPADGTNYMDAIKDADVKGMKIAYWSHHSYCVVDDAVLEQVNASVETFRSMGAIVEEVESPLTKDPGQDFWAMVAESSDLTEMRKMVEGREDEISPVVLDFMQKNWTAEMISDAHFVRQRVNQEIRGFMRDYDLLLTPTLTAPAFPIGAEGPLVNGKAPEADWTAFTFLFNLTGMPAANVPAGWTKEGLPVGMQIVGRPLDEYNVLRASAAFEKARPWADRWPEIAL